MADDKAVLTVGELVSFLEDHGVKPDTEVWVERESIHNDDGNWHDTCPEISVEMSSTGYQRVVFHINS